MLSRFLAFDLGAESGRALLGTLDSGRLSLEERHRFTNPTGRLSGHLHWDVLGQWEQIKAGLRQTAGVRLDGIGVDTWGVDFGLLGPAGELLGLPYHYRDQRTRGVMEQAIERVGRERLFELTGIQFLPFNTLFQLLAAQRDQPQVLKLARTLLFMPDLFNYLLTRVKRSESSIASTSQMIDPRSGQWATGLLQELGLPTQLLAEIVPSGTVLENLDEAVAEECGVAAMPVIAPACHDTASAVAAVPARTGESWCYLSSGTWSLMGVELPAPLINAASLQHNYTNEGGVGGTIRFLKNIMGLWLVQECRRHWSGQGQEYSYAQLAQMAREARAFECLVEPDDESFLAPGRMPEKIEQYCRKTRQPVPATPGQVVRACLESLALAYRRTLQGMEDVLGRRIEAIYIVGGGSRNGLLNQMTADACGRRVWAGPVEATAMGNILVQAMAVGAIKSLAEAREVVWASVELEAYEPRETAQWDRAYERFVAME